MATAGSLAIQYDCQSIWHTLCDRLRRDLGEITYRNWIRHLVFKNYTGGHFIMGAPTRFIKEWIETNYSSIITEIVREALPDLRALTFEVDPDLVTIIPTTASNQNDEMNAQSKQSTEEISKQCDVLDFSLDARFTFENFIVGESNKSAYSMAKMAAENRMCGNANIIYIHSTVGQGKTHLLQAIASFIKTSHDGRTVLYLSAEKFLHLYVKYTRNNDLIGFKEKIKSTDLLLVDDLQFICGKVATQQEFSNLLSALLEAGKTVILSSDSNPFALNLDARSKSRITGGFVVEITPPELELRAAILRSKAKRAKVEISEELVELISSSISASVRELEGALNQLIAYHNFENTMPTPAVAKQILRNNLEAVKRKISLTGILEEVARHYGVEVESLKSKSRAAKLILPRQVFSLLAKEFTTHSMQDIGKFLGGRDHTSVVYYIKQIHKTMQENTTVKAAVEQLSQHQGG